MPFRTAQSREQGNSALHFWRSGLQYVLRDAWHAPRGCSMQADHCISAKYDMSFIEIFLEFGFGPLGHI